MNSRLGKEAMGRLVLEASTGMHGAVAKQVALELTAALEAQQAGGKPVAWRTSTEVRARLRAASEDLPKHSNFHDRERPAGDIWRTVLLSDLRELLRHAGWLDELAAPVQQVDAQSEPVQAAWRDLALQFDGHRMQALGWLRLAAEELPRTPAWSALRDFIAAPPLSGVEVLHQRVAALAAQPAAERVPLTDGQIRSMCKHSWTFETVKQWVRLIERDHGITATSSKESGNG